MKRNEILKRLVLIASSVICSAAMAADYSKLVVFGDSMSDTHRLYDYTTANWGESDPGPPNYDGRFADGPVAVEFLAQNLGLTLQNYAFAGATSGTDTLLLVTEGMLTQVNEYLANPAVVPPVTTVSNYLFKPAKPRADPDALHMIWTGPDDFYRLLIGMTNLTGYSVMSNVKTAVGRLYAGGARHFFIPEMPDISMTPSAKLHNTFQPGYIWSARVCTDSFQRLLAQGIVELRKKYPDAKFMTHGTLAFMRTEFVKVRAEGKDLTTPCRKEGAFDLSKLSTGPATVCPDVSNRVFWDGNHPTSWVNKVLADEWTSAVNEQR